ncbi:MAG: HlyD family efflux transporter periplasmic adaptor subunit [Chloroflexi bacterium]|nr:HlyD family efflux transporter periplasmic adaptor subunit [Chloroflexota bacterium]
MKLKAAIAVVLLAIAVAAVGSVFASPFGPAPAQYLTAAVVKTTVAQQIVASGSVRSAATYDLAFGASPVLELGAPAAGGAGGAVWLVSTVVVKTGDRVTRGAVLATADTAAATASVQLAKAGLAAAKARLAVDGAGPTAADRAAAYDAILQAQQQLDLARQTGTVTSQQSSLQVRQAEAALVAARAKLAADQTAGPVTSTIQADQAAVLAAQQQVDTLTLENRAAATQAGGAAQASALKVSQAQAALQAAAAQLAADQAAHASAATIATDRAAVAQAQTALDAANLDLSTASASSSQAAQLSALKLTQAQQALQAAQARLAADQAAGPPVATIQSDQAAIATAQAQLDSLRLSIKSSATQASGQISSAALSLSIAQNGYASKVVGATAATISTDQSAVAGAQETLRLAQLTLDGATLRSPVDGIVVAVNVVAGAAAPAGLDVAVSAASLQVTATVTETDLPSLKLGQKADVSLTALGTTATATVLSISPTGSIPGSGGVVTYPIVLALATPPAGTFSGMSAQVTIITAQATNVLAVPSIALNGGTGQYTVQVLDASGKPQNRPVQVGLITGTLAEITSGLAVGDLVVTGTVAPLSGTNTSGGGLPGLLPAAPAGGGQGGG